MIDMNGEKLLVGDFFITLPFVDDSDSEKNFHYGQVYSELESMSKTSIIVGRMLDSLNCKLNYFYSCEILKIDNFDDSKITCFMLQHQGK